MAEASLVFTPILIFLAALLLALVLYAWGRAMAPPPHPVGHKREMYTGGEAPKKQELRPSYEFFHIAMFFTLLHVGALVIVTAPSGDAAVLALAYLSVLALGVAALIRR